MKGIHKIAMSVMLTAWGGPAFAQQQMTYDGHPGPDKATLATAGALGLAGGVPWLNLGAGWLGLVYGGVGNPLATGADLVVDYASPAQSPGFVIGGYSDLSGAGVTGNRVTLAQGPVDGPVLGGLAQRTNIHDPVNTSGQAGSSATWGDASAHLVVSERVGADHNTVTIAGTENAGVIGGGRATLWIRAGDVITGDAASAGGSDAYAYAYATAVSANASVTASGNTVMAGGILRSDGVYGGLAQLVAQSGRALAGDAQAASASSFGNAHAYASADASVDAYGAAVTASGNTVMVDVDMNGHAVQGGLALLQAHAARAEAGAASAANGYRRTEANAFASADVSGSTVSANGNTVTVGGSLQYGAIRGGYAEIDAAGSSATGGTTTTNFADQQAMAKVVASNTHVLANDNAVTLNGVLYSGDIHGGHARFNITLGNATKGDGSPGDSRVDLAGSQAQATGNTVTLGENAVCVSCSLYGGFLGHAPGLEPETYDVFTGNTLNWSARTPGSFATVANFEHYNFTIDPVHANTGTALIDAQEIVLGADATNTRGGNPPSPSKVAVRGFHSGAALQAGDRFILMRADDMKGGGVGLTTSSIAQQGISLLYEVQTDVDISGKVATATILAATPGGAARVNPQLKALSEGHLAGAMLVSRGADAIAYDAFSTISSQNHQAGWGSFIQFGGSHANYHSGSHVKSDDFLLTGGLSWQQDHLTAGAFAEGGWGSYDSYNSFYNAADVKGNGHGRYYGLGLLGRYDAESGLYADASLRFGRNRNKFDTQDIQNIATGERASYNVTGRYVSAHVGAGYILTLSDQNQLDLSAKYLWTRLGGQDVNVTGDPIRFERINSHRARLTARLNHRYSEALTFHAGLGYEHEFDGKARATAYGLAVDAPSVRGGVGIFSLGASLQPGAFQNLKLDFRLDGYAGKREGAGASIGINYAF